MSMGLSIDIELLRNWALHRQRLLPDSRGSDVLTVVNDIVALHATDSLSPYLSLRERMPAFKRQTLDDLLEKDRCLGKVRFVRKTVHVLPRPHLPLAFAALKSLLIPRAEVWLAHLDLSSREYARLSRRIEAILAEEGKTTQEVKRDLEPGLPVSPVLNMMCDEGRLVRGLPRKGWKNNLHVYHPWSAYFPDIDLHSVTESEARTWVIRRYIEVFGPVSKKDIVWWTRFPSKDINEILRELAPGLSECEVRGLGSGLLIPIAQGEEITSLPPLEGPVVNLLPLLDPLLMGYKERGRLLNPDFEPFVIDQTGNTTSVILVDGEVKGVWDYKVMKDPEIKLHWFEKPSALIRQETENLAQDRGRFLSDEEVRIVTCTHMSPFAERTVGGFMSPLKDEP
ncbi:MAG: winged helix DNA-binding domain-containing protein [Candidatus Aminicenantaceae bacterium]